MQYPAELKYTKEHEWVKIDGKHATIGVTHYAIEQLGDVVYLDLPKVGSSFKANETFGTIESTKTVSDLFMPLSAKVTEINKAMVEFPENLARDAYHEGWLVKVEIEGAPENLLSAEQYDQYVKSHA